jgi:demethylmenaquinone methyltransferase/2-methoxy-6-polyprenyl-1,4-benzoquinol methylase
VARCYEALARIYSRGRIAAAKASQIEEMRPGQRALYAGVGCGEDAVLAARRGVRLSAVDLSPAMLRALRVRLDGEGLAGELIRGDVLDHRGEEPYDVVAANFFLNVFAEEVMLRVLAHLASQVRPGGKLLVADFAPPVRPGARAWIHALYYRPANLAAWALGLCALHPIYDYAPAAERLGLRLGARRRFCLGRAGPELYESLVFERPAHPKEARVDSRRFP